MTLPDERNAENIYDAYYKLSNPADQIKAYVEQVILGHVPGMTLDEVFAKPIGDRRSGEAGTGCRHGRVWL